MVKSIRLQSFLSGTFYDVKLNENNLISISSDSQSVELSVTLKDTTAKVENFTYISDEFSLHTLEAIFSLFFESVEEILLEQSPVKNREDFQQFLKENLFAINRSSFSELGNIWAKQSNPKDEAVSIQTGEVTHPRRPAYSPGELLYKKYFPVIDKTISYRVADIENDLDNFHSWHNKEFIYKFWELNKSKEELREYLAKGLKDPHSIPTIMEFDNKPVGYFEFYWAKEDRLGPFYDFSDYDRGFHFLIGELECLGQRNVDSILKATSHYAFLNDQRTDLLAGEPRSDNKKIIRYVDHFDCWRNEKEFDFPHKRAALLLCDRETYFREGYPWA
ncbi:hypothetical protein BIY24_02645 [Halobacteriovorax marinus]|uniref:GNAT family N-acetyltransferase n=1 Tax=Halobacteriovorax marinus TaxID=97084 RepID=UPI000BC35FE3|nr:GNAT family N-acetyltransferase [Halobacteriovorax marinus]ATH06871.1 hypothetical protein BIY24_02645 [Halobacteriovorax marinus]